MRKKHNDIRRLLVQEAARLMFEEGVSQYLDAKKKAAKRILGRQIKNLPSNGEISDELYRLATFHQGDARNDTLFEMRLLAMEVMEQLSEFSPGLIGSVSTGRIRKGSDIDLHLFTDSLETVQNRIEELRWEYEIKQVWIQKNGQNTEYNHIYVDLNYPVELSVYPLNDIRIRSRSSTDGKPIERLKVARVRELIMSEHAEAWEKYLAEDNLE